eukprot:TRINITY_DN63398_c0_g1_i1.p2 TRINITY_DN63398_c0_g1~~TRINITY_DN63398_c0_g1_i1.p2  ORF type:complete len:261 (-),score=22.31 TRINITY_DN63398_c0_g1_i1:980-1738(-)
MPAAGWRPWLVNCHVTQDAHNLFIQSQTDPRWFVPPKDWWGFRKAKLQLIKRNNEVTQWSWSNKNMVPVIGADDIDVDKQAIFVDVYDWTSTTVDLSNGQGISTITFENCPAAGAWRGSTPIHRVYPDQPLWFAFVHAHCGCPVCFGQNRKDNKPVGEPWRLPCYYTNAIVFFKGQHQPEACVGVLQRDVLKQQKSWEPISTIYGLERVSTTQQGEEFTSEFLATVSFEDRKSWILPFRVVSDTKQLKQLTK